VANTKLSLQQNKVIAEGAKSILTAATSTTPIDNAVCIDAISSAYSYLGLNPPEIMFFSNPIRAMAELQRRMPLPSEEKSPTTSRPLTNNDHANLGAIVFEMISAAQPRIVSALGQEVDLTFNDELNRAIESSCALSIWNPLSKLVDRQLGNVIHYMHAVNNLLEDLVTHREHKWLLYSGGIASIWYGAEGFARVQALHDIGASEALPQGHDHGSSALQSCGWVKAFEKLCLVSDRPGALTQSGRVSDPDGVVTQLAWRDGQTCKSTYM
jgi:hypothetical protein